MPGESDLMARLREEADACHSWSNGAGDVYGAHAHSYVKVLYCVAGSITFTLSAREVALIPPAFDPLPEDDVCPMTKSGNCCPAGCASNSSSAG